MKHIYYLLAYFALCGVMGGLLGAMSFGKMLAVLGCAQAMAITFHKSRTT